MRVGFIGLGNMGRPMAQRLVDAELDVVVYDISSEATAQLVAGGAEAAESPLAVAETAEIVLVSLPTPGIVEAVALGHQGLIGGRAIQTFVDLSTSGPTAMKRLSEALGDASIATVDAPVSGGTAGASRGTLAIMAAAPSEVFDSVSPILEHLGRVFLVGETPGMGQSMKLLNNYLSATALATTAEAFAFGAKSGLTAQSMVDVVNASSGRNSATEDKFPRAVLTGTFDFGFTTELMCKDLRLFSDEAESQGVPLWVGSSARQLWQHANARLGPDSDLTEIVKLLEGWAGVELRSDGRYRP